jgi:hypothetical protein
MNKSKLLALYVLKVWLFNDSIVKLTTKKNCEITRTHHTIELKGDSINENHLDQILDKFRHQYMLVSSIKMCTMVHLVLLNLTTNNLLQ